VLTVIEYNTNADSISISGMDIIVFTLTTLLSGRLVLYIFIYTYLPPQAIAALAVKTHSLSLRIAAV